MVTRIDFLSAVLPPLQPGEHYCSWGNKKENGKERVRQKFATSLEELIEQCDELQATGYNSFYALAKYGPTANGRYAINARELKTFFLDLDCGEGKPYPSLEEGILALKTFCRAVKLPRPTIIRSGRGAHVYWVLKEPLSRQEWKPYADQLKQLCIDNSFDVDLSVPGDAARILRMPDTLHMKDPNNPLPVAILAYAGEVDTASMKELLAPKSLPSNDALEGLEKPDYIRQMDPVTMAIIGSSEAKFKTILDKSLAGTGCNQILYIVENQQDMPEPMWRAGLSIAQCCSDKEKAIHFISRKHPEYSREVTERKAAETKGPYTCETFRKLNPQACQDCKHKITSPIQLGKQIQEATEAESVVAGVESTTKEIKTYAIPKFPFPFFRGKAGGVFIHSKNKDDEDIEEVVYPYDFYVLKRINDPDMGETILLRLHLPKDGVRDFIMPLTNALSKEKFINTVAAQGITILGKRQDLLMQYVAKWVEDLQMKAVAEKAHKQFGWLEDESGIIIGDREIRATEVVYSPPSAPTLPNIPLFQPKGDFHVWKDIINAYARPGMEYRAFSFFMGFGTLLMKFTSLDGFILNLVHKESGSGKSTILHAINSIYGRPKDLMLTAKDTVNARMQRLGTMQNLAVTMDEITNLPPDQMSNMAYDVTSGRGKNRLRQHDNAERLNHTKWQTGMITSSNRYIMDALLSLKNFPDGELKRIMEISIKLDENDDATWARQHFGRLFDNYGHAIQPYAQALVAQVPMVKETLANIQLRVDQAAQVRNPERYWALMVSLATAGGTIAKQLNLHDIPIKPVFDYGIELLKMTRDRVKESIFDSEEFLGGFLQRHFHEILVINGNKDTRTGLEFGPIREPRGALTARYEPDTKMLYVVQRTFRDDCAKGLVNFNEVVEPYYKCKALIGIKKKRMTTGTVASTQAPVNALCFDTRMLEFFDEAILVDQNANNGRTALD